MRAARFAEALVTEFCITDPSEIDVEALAFEKGLLVEYRDLSGCEATLAGFGNRAIATVKPSKYRGRTRFSLAHELGHWQLHRGRSFKCRVDDPGENLASDQATEKEADAYAAHLLMPSQIFNPVVKKLGRPGFHELNELGEQFQTSLLATSIRLAHINTLPVVVACYGHQGLRWRVAADDVPKRWWLRQELDDDSFAYDLYHHGTEQAKPKKQAAETWFENSDADEFEVLEHCVGGRAGEVLVLLYLEEDMLEAGYDPDVGNRKYNEYGSYITRRR